MSRADAISVSRGFSALELLVVVVIVGLLAAVSVPWFAKIRRRTELRSAAMEIGTTLLAARMKAIKRNVVTSVVITASSGTAAHVLDTTEAAVPPPPPPAPTPMASANSLATLNISSRAIRFVATPGGGMITFDGSGRRTAPLSPTPGVIVIEGPVGIGPTNQITIDTSLSGRVRIVTPVVWQ